jgi:CSLREA domain-containing protein
MAATFTVTKTNDTNDGTCDADCSLREAIIAANSMPGADTIVLQSGQTYTLSLENAMTPGDEDTAAEDDLDVVAGSTITIQGNGATIQRSTAVTCNPDGMVVAGEFRIFEVLGGMTPGNLTLQNVTVRDGCADGSGGEPKGGGILNNGGTLTVTGSTISGNSATDDGGGISNFGAGGTVTVTNSTISGNSTQENGGGIWNGSTLTVTNSTISGNSASSSGGGIRNNFGGTVTVTGSTISGNSAGNDGGAIDNSGTVNLLNVTISGNSSGSGSQDVGGIWNGNTVNASFVTIANNTGSTTGAGGIFNLSGATVNIKNSILGNNTSGGAPNCAGALTASGANLATDGTCTGFSTVPSTGPGGLNLGALQVNAPGTTATHALQAGSAAIDAVMVCTDLSNAPVPTDQRGVLRAQGSLCDVGAYEARGVVSMDGNGHCLEIETDTGTYQFIRSGGQLFTGQLTSRLRGMVLSFQNRRSEPRLLKGTVNFGSGRGSAALILPLSAGGGRAIINDPNILSNPTCP